MTIAATESSVLAQDDWKSLYVAGEISDPTHGSLKYRAMAPEGLGEETTVTSEKKYPLVLFLHGAGERGDDNEAQLKHCAGEFAKPIHRKNHATFVVFPQCPQEQKWAEVDWSRREIDFADEPGRVMQLVFKLVDQMIAEKPIDPKRVYIAGLSMGGYGTWHAVGLRPKFWAGAIPICGGSDLGWAERQKETPIWAFHGDKDRAVPVENSRQIVKRLKELDAPVIYTEYPGVDHDSWTQTIANGLVHDWLFSQHR